MLDPFTALVITATTTAACGLVLLACCHRAVSGPLVIWAIAMVAAAGGLVLSAILATHDPPVQSAATAILLAAAALFWTATRMFRGPPPRWALAAAGPALWLATAPFHTGAQGWTAAACLLGASYTAASLAELFRLRDERLSTWTVAVTLTAAHAAIYVGRALLALAAAIAPGFVEIPDWIVPALITEAMIHISGNAIVLVALLLERDAGRASRELRRAAYQDGLTGIANRRRFDERLDEIAGDLRQRNASLGLILLDLDHFKSVNDTVGHGEGDRILRLVAVIIATNVRPGADLAARYGGEEFAILVVDTSLEHLRVVAERIRAAVEAARIPHPGKGGFITISAGIGSIVGSEIDARRHHFIAQTDRALYEAKRLGRNRVAASLPQPRTQLFA